jgi:hypothetical protein
MAHPDFPNDAEMAARPPHLYDPPRHHKQTARSNNRAFDITVIDLPSPWYQIWIDRRHPADIAPPLDHQTFQNLLITKANWKDNPIWHVLRSLNQARNALRGAIDNLEHA